jgi:hypothetical protein
MILAGPFDAVFYARRNDDVVALGQILDVGLAFKTHPGRSGQDHNPFGPGLIVPKPRRACVAQGNDPLYPQIAGFEEGRDALSMHIALRSLEQISGQR